MDISLTMDNIRDFRSRYEADRISQVTTRAASKTAINDICYDTPHAARMNHKFSVDIPTMSATNQRSSGRCWIFASMNILREKVAKDLKLADFELSQSYISFFDDLE